jgi:uncharacterized glyoxalase superfamily protein PhnB
MTETGRTGASSNPPPTPPPVTPYLNADDAHAAMAFYEKAFRVKVLSRQDTPDGQKVIHGMVVLSDDCRAAEHFPARS